MSARDIADDEMRAELGTFLAALARITRATATYEKTIIDRQHDREEKRRFGHKRTYSEPRLNHDPK